MKLKKKTIYYLEGMLDKNKEEKYKKEIKTRPDIEEFIRVYRWIEDNLIAYFRQYPLKEKATARDTDIDGVVEADIRKYLRNYPGPPTAVEDLFVKKVEDVLDKKNSFFRRNSGLILNIAATISLAVLLVSAFMHIYPTQKNLVFQSHLFSQYFQPGQDPYLKTLNPDLYIFLAEELEKPRNRASKKLLDFGLIVRNDKLKPEDLLLYSVALINNNELIQAETHLTGLLEESGPPLLDAVNWYLALLKLKEGKATEATKYLGLLCFKSSGYSNSSCNILHELKKMDTD